MTLTSSAQAGVDVEPPRSLVVAPVAFVNECLNIVSVLALLGQEFLTCAAACAAKCSDVSAPQQTLRTEINDFNQTQETG